MPIKDDDRGIVAIIVKIKKKFDAKKNYEKRGKLKEEAKEKFKTELENSTVNLAPNNWRERILKDRSVRAEARHRKVSVLEDYIGYNSTRCWGWCWCWCWCWFWVWCWCWCWCRCWELGRGSRRGHGEQDGSSGAVVTLPEQWEHPRSSGSTPGAVGAVPEQWEHPRSSGGTPGAVGSVATLH